jgi:hypothetical protein
MYIRPEWEVIAHHMTINFGAESHPEEGECKFLTVTHFGELENVCAVRVSTGELELSNDIPHVTIAVDRENGGKPFFSNKITEWTELKSPLVISGVIKVCY